MFNVLYDQDANTIRLVGGSESDVGTPARMRVLLSSLPGNASTRVQLTRSRVSSFANIIVEGYFTSDNYNWSFTAGTSMTFEGGACNMRAQNMEVSFNSPILNRVDPISLTNSTTATNPGQPTLQLVNCSFIIDDSNNSTYRLEPISANSFIKNLSFRNSLVDSPTNAARATLELAFQNNFVGNIITYNMPIVHTNGTSAVDFNISGTSNRSDGGVAGISDHVELIFSGTETQRQLATYSIPFQNTTSRLNFGFIGDTEEMTVNINDALFDYNRIDINGENTIRCSRSLTVDSRKYFESETVNMFVTINETTNTVTGSQVSSRDDTRIQLAVADVWVGTGAPVAGADPRADYVNPLSASGPATITENFEHTLVARSFDSLYVTLPFNINDDTLDLTGQDPTSVPLQIQFSRDPAIPVGEAQAAVLAAGLIYTTDQVEVTSAISLNDFYVADKWHKTRSENLILAPVVTYRFGVVANVESTFYTTAPNINISITGSLSGRGQALDVQGTLEFGTFGRTSAFYRYVNRSMQQVVTWGLDSGTRDFALRITNTTSGAVELANLLVPFSTLLDGVLIREIISGENHSALICPSDGTINRVAINSDAAPVSIEFLGFAVFSPLAGYSIQNLRTMTGSTNGATFSQATRTFTINNAGEIDTTVLLAWIQLGIMNNLQHFNTHPMTFERPTVTFTGISILFLGDSVLVDPVGFINFVPGTDGVFRNPIFGNPDVTHIFNLQFSGTSFTAVIYAPAPGQPPITSVRYLVVDTDTGETTEENVTSVGTASVSLAVSNVNDDLLVYAQIAGYRTHLVRINPSTAGARTDVDDLQLLPPIFSRNLNINSFLSSITVAIVNSVIQITFGSTTDIAYTPEVFIGIMYRVETMDEVFSLLVANGIHRLFDYTDDGGVVFSSPNVQFLVPDDSSAVVSTTAQISYSGSVPINSPVLNPFNAQTDPQVPPVRFEVLPVGAGPSFRSAFDEAIIGNRVLTIEGFERLNQG